MLTFEHCFGPKYYSVGLGFYNLECPMHGDLKNYNIVALEKNIFKHVSYICLC